MIKLQEFRTLLMTNRAEIVDNIPQIKVKNNIWGNLHTVHKKDIFNPTYTITELIDETGKVLGKEVLSFEKNKPDSIGMSIEVIPECRKKGFNFGEILRLSSIMMLIENKVKNFEIYSKDTAVYFHSKYFFEPAIKQFKERNYALQSVIRNCKNNEGFGEFENEAENLLETSLSNNDPACQRELCIKTNLLLKKYIKNVLQTKDDYKNHPFNFGMRMKLTDDIIYNNKAFFNKLFEKHGIDYII